MVESRRPHNWFWNSVASRWELRGIAKGEPIAYANDLGLGVPQNLQVGQVATIGRTLNVGTLAVIQQIRVGVGATLAWIEKVIGTTPAVSAIGSGAVTTVTLTNFASLGIAVGDKVFCNPKQALAGHIAFGGAHIPTTNVINIYLGNTKPDSAGSAPAIGWDALLIR